MAMWKAAVVRIRRPAPDGESRRPKHRNW